MNSDFIHTLELYYRDDFNEIKELTRNITLVNMKGKYVCTDYSSIGITIYSLPCMKEGRDGKGNYKLSLVVNPSRLIEEYTCVNRIEGYRDLEKAIDSLNCFISRLFSPLILNDFKLGRIDITRDIRKVPGNVIREYILLMRTMTLGYGYKKNKKLEENTKGFRIDDSFNVLNKSQGAEFVVYNKHSAAKDQGYPEKVVEYYKKTMRMELRLQRRYIRNHTNYMDTDEAIYYFYSNTNTIFKDFYSGMFKYRTDLCFVSYGWQIRLIHRSYPDSVKEQKMLNIIYSIINDRLHADRFFYKTYHTKKSTTRILSPFNEIGFSPISIINDKISFMSSLDSVLGLSFNKKDEMGQYENTSNKKVTNRTNENEIYKVIKKSKGRKKVIFYVGEKY